VFDSHSFLTRELVGPPNVLALFSAYKLRIPKVSTVEKWFQRKSLPGEWLALILCILELERGEPVRLAKYLIEGETR
jgi:hypothetical protein